MRNMPRIHTERVVTFKLVAVNCPENIENFRIHVIAKRSVVPVERREPELSCDGYNRFMLPTNKRNRVVG